MALSFQFKTYSTAKAASVRHVRCAAVPLHVDYMPRAGIMQHLSTAPTEEVARLVAASSRFPKTFMLLQAPGVLLPGSADNVMAAWGQEVDTDTKILDTQGKIRDKATAIENKVNKKIDQQKGPWGPFSQSSSQE